MPAPITSSERPSSTIKRPVSAIRPPYVGPGRTASRQPAMFGDSGQRRLAKRGPWRRNHPRYHHLLPIQHLRDARCDRVLPVVALVDSLVEPLAILLAFKSADPDVEVRVLFCDKAADDDHALRDLEGDEDLFHEPHPGVPLTTQYPVLPELEQHPHLLRLVAIWGQWPGGEPPPPSRRDVPSASTTI